MSDDSAPDARDRVAGAPPFDTASIQLRDLDELFEARPSDPLGGRFESRSGVDQLVDQVNPSLRPLRIDLFVQPGEPGEHPHPSEQHVKHALEGYAAMRISRIDREQAQIRRLGLKELMFGLVFLAACLVVSGIVAALGLGPYWLRNFIVEGLVIIGWIALWHPVDMLFFARVPLLREQLVLRRLQSAEVRVRAHDQQDPE